MYQLNLFIIQQSKVITSLGYYLDHLSEPAKSFLIWKINGEDAYKRLLDITIIQDQKSLKGFVCSAIVSYKTIKSLLSHICNMYSCSAKQCPFTDYLKRFEKWNHRNVIAKLKWIYRIIFGGKMRRLAMILVTYWGQIAHRIV